MVLLLLFLEGWGNSSWGTESLGSWSGLCSLMTSELCIQGRLFMKNRSYQLVGGVAVGLPHKGRYLLLEIDIITRIDHACGSFQKQTGNDRWNSTNPLKSVYATPWPPLPPCSPLTGHTLGLTQDLETGPEKML